MAEDAVCEKADDGCAIKGSERYLKMVCTEVSRPVPSITCSETMLSVPGLASNIFTVKRLFMMAGLHHPLSLCLLAGL